MKHSNNSIITFHKKVFITLLFFTISIITFSQPQQRVWALPGNQIKFTPTFSVSSLGTANYAGEMPNTTANSMTDYNGNLLFYVLDEDSQPFDVSPSGLTNPNTDAINIFDKDGNFIDFFLFPSGPEPTSKVAGEIGIIPKPGSCSEYYIIVGVGATGIHTPYHPEYATLDMSKANRNDPTKKGALEYISPDVNSHNLQYEDPAHLLLAWDSKDQGAATGTGAPSYENNRLGIAIAPCISSNNYFLYINGLSNLYRFNVTNSGISLDISGADIGVVDHLLTEDATLGYAVNDNNNYSEMEIIQFGGGYRLARIDDGNGSYSFTSVRVYDFDNTGQYISTPTLTAHYHSYSLRNTTPPLSPLIQLYGTGLEIDPSGNKIYYTNRKFDGTGIPSVQTGQAGYFNLLEATPVPHLLTTPVSPPNDVTLGYSFIERGFDGRMYYNLGSSIMSSLVPESGGWITSPLPNLTTETLPDQIDGKDYQGNPIFVNYTVGTLGSPTYTAWASTTQIWTPTSNPFYTSGAGVGTATNPIIILGELVIPAGYNVTIQGMTFKFKARTFTSATSTFDWGARVLVQNSTSASTKGARLTLTSFAGTPTTFTSDNTCSSGMWEGIDVWGDNLTPQGTFGGITSATIGKQGWLRVINSVVSNAYEGALAGRKDYSFSSTATAPTIYVAYGGGVIQSSSNSAFLNNSFGVYFSPYNISNNQSYFNNTSFATNITFTGVAGAKPIAMAFLNDVNGIYFRICSFYNDVSKYPILSSGNLFGIRAYQSQFFCVAGAAPPTSTTGCTFDNFRYGIYATFTSNAKTVTVDYATLSNNYRGIYLSGAKLTPTIVHSKFYIMPYIAPTVSYSAYGLYMNACTGYKVEENYFTTVGLTAGINDFGMIVSNSGSDFNKIYNNKFEVLYAGIEARAKNYAASSFVTNFNDIGLQLRCNTFITGTIKSADMAVTSGGVPDGAIDYHQGYAGDPAGNQFSHTGSPSWDYFDWNNTLGHRINYITHSDANRIPLIYSAYPAILVSTPPAGTDLFDASTDCLSSMTGASYGFPINVLQTNIKTYLQNLAPLQLLLANGDASSLYTAIGNLSMSPGTLKNLLMSQSPYLSDGVLIAYINRSGVPNGNLKDVLIANSQLTQPVKDALAAISLPNGIRNQINAAQKGTSQRQVVDDKIHYYLYNIAITKNDIIRNYVNDSTLEFKTDTIISKIKEDETIDMIGSTKNILADLYVEKGLYTQADSVINVIALDPTKQNVAKLKRVNKALKQSGQTTDALITDVANKAKVYEVAADYGIEGYEVAMNILQKVFEEPYQEPIDELTGVSYHNYTPINGDQPAASTKLAVIYPNPNNGTMQLDYQLSDDETGVVKIMDVTGKLIVTYVLEKDKTNIAISEAALKNGVYFYQIIVNGEVVNSDKLVIIKN
jgi:hypothetical protein